MRTPADRLADLSDDTVECPPLSLLFLCAACLVGAIERPLAVGWDFVVRWWKRGERFQGKR